MQPSGTGVGRQRQVHIESNGFRDRLKDLGQIHSLIMECGEPDHLAMEVVISSDINLGGNLPAVVDGPDAYRLIGIFIIKASGE